MHFISPPKPGMELNKLSLPCPYIHSWDLNILEDLRTTLCETTWLFLFSPPPPLCHILFGRNPEKEFLSLFWVWALLLTCTELTTISDFPSCLSSLCCLCSFSDASGRFPVSLADPLKVLAQLAPHSSTLAWKIPWTGEPDGLQFMGSLRVGHDWATSPSLFTFMHWRRKWQPTPVFLPGESQGRGSLVGCRLWGRTELDTTEAT